MGFEFMGAFRRIKGDDNFSKYLRISKATYIAILAGSMWFMLQSARWVGHESQSFDADLTFLIFTVIISATLFVASGSDTQSFSAPVRYFVPGILVLALVLAETTTLLGWWNLEEMLLWWRRAIFAVLGASFLHWAGQKAVQIKRARPEDV